jgi:riboflavin biosynthesis pyrimidine reductase
LIKYETLFELESPEPLAVPPELASGYGNLRLPEKGWYGNFVCSLDGVVAFGKHQGAAGRLISGASEADRFLMGVLRASSDAIVIGAGTLRAEPQHLWTPARVFPSAEGLYDSLRRHLKLPLSPPQLYVVTASGDLDPGHPVFGAGAIVLTTAGGIDRLPAGLRPSARVIPGDGAVAALDLADVVAHDGHRRVLTEGGPALMGSLLDAGCVDQLFLTLSPVVAGGGKERQRFSGSFEFLPNQGRWGRLVSLRRCADMLFLQYAF